nr:MAG TPA: hypothetical protein [Caudoviricetes sp.]
MQICIGVEGALAPHAQQRRIPERSLPPRLPTKKEKSALTIFARSADWFTSISAKALRVNSLRKFLMCCSR